MKEHQYLTGIVNKLQFSQRLDRALTELFPSYSRSHIKTWILSGQVKINGRIIVTPKKMMLGGEVVEIQLIKEKETYWKAQNITLNIVYEDDYILVINKPRNMVVHPGAGNTDSTVLNALLYYFPPIAHVPRTGIVHRLDKDTTGLMVIAKTIQAQQKLVGLLQAHSIIREYEAIVIGTLTAGGLINQSIARHSTRRTRMAVHPMGKSAITHYRILEHFRAHTLLRLRLETGRTHQIRVHMAHINHPLVGDLLYSGRSRMPRGASENLNEVLRKFNRQALHATMLQIYHPITSAKVEWRAPLPQDMVKLINMLRVDTEQLKH